jgi:hypothetical protein
MYKNPPVPKYNLHKLKKQCSYLLFTIAVLSGCQSYDIEKVYFPRGEVGVLNNEDKNELYKPENTAGVGYELGISLSGGGMRSASFSMGILAGLSDTNVIKELDFLSTVSGGGYAGYFLMSQLFYADKGNTSHVYNNFFDDCVKSDTDHYKDNYLYPNCTTMIPAKSTDYMYQNHVNRQTDLLFYYTDGGGVFAPQVGETFGILSSHILSLIPHHVSNSLFDWGINWSTLTHSYKNGIERTFGLSPIDESADHTDFHQFHNAQPFLWANNYSAKTLSFGDLKRYTLRSLSNCTKLQSKNNQCVRAPIWIINTTAGVADQIYETLGAVPDLKDSVFEVSSLMYGSGEHGYVHDSFEQLDISQTVAASGAAADTQFTGETFVGASGLGIGALLHTFNINLGRTIENYNPNRASNSTHGLLPFPLYYLHGFNRNKSSNDIYLSDGGHSENLGAYSLIVRGVKNIIIVDAEHDPEGKWGALTRLASRLKIEHGLTLRLIDKDVNLDLIDENTAEEITDIKVEPFDADRHIYRGIVSGYRDDFVADKTVNILYVKTSVIQDLVSPECEKGDINGAYPCSFYEYYRKHYLTKDKNNECKPKSGKRDFPNHDTFLTAANMTSDVYTSYRDLARVIARRITFSEGKVDFKALPPDIDKLDKSDCD